MADFTAPSFSLGLDFDLDQANDPNQQSPEPVVVDLISSQSVQEEEEDDDDFDFHSKTLDSDLQAAVDNDDTPPLPVLKRLKRGLPASVSKQQAPELVVNHDNNDDEIEDVDVPTTDGHSKLQNHSACSSSKFPSHGFVPLSTQFTSKLKRREHTQASNASSRTSTEKSNNKIMFPKLTVSPLRRFQLLDSDSDTDDPSSSEDLLEDDKTVDISTSKRRRNANEKTVVNHQERDMVKSKLQTEDLWKDFGPQKSINIPTPALDDFCEEYFRPVKNKNVDQNKDKDIYDGSPKICEQNNIIGENAELFKNLNKPLPPAYKYFYHDDPRIKSLIRSRLPNFFPLGVHNKETPQSEHADIDYMCQFDQKEPTSRNKITEGSSRAGRKTINQSNCKAASEISGGWVNPKSYTSTSRNTGNSQGLVGGHSSVTPTNAGKRRVRAVGNSSGSWFTSEGGKKVYVAKNGQELSGRSAYCQYRKESGTGFKKSRKKVASKKKSKR